MISYGHGDGGGGPERAQIENLRELKCFPSMPNVQVGKVGNFFRELEATAGPRLPVGRRAVSGISSRYLYHPGWSGANRRSELALHDAEFLCFVGCGAG